MAEIFQIEVGMMQNFNTFIWDGNGTGAIVDPAYEVDRLLREAQTRGLRIEAILLTHTHHDHVDGAEEMARATSARVYVGRGELENAQRAAPSATVIPLDGGEMLSVGQLRIEVMPTPGHT